MFKIMFLCTGNFCHSQIAEELVNKFRDGLIESFCIGFIAAGVNPMPSC